MNTVKSDSKISLHYSLSLEDGPEIENNFDDEPLVCFIGDGTLAPGMEDALIDLKAGDNIDVTVPPEQGYGYPDEENIHSLPASDFSADMEIAVGDVIAFDSPDENEEIPGTIIEIKGEEVVVDFSHPLAGRHLTFKATIIAIEND
jgi:FKBP-type peptidyl-prolyl cis-trans isomerase SlpA